MYDFEKMSREQLIEIAKAALALSTKMVDTEEIVSMAEDEEDSDLDRSSFQIEPEWRALTFALSHSKFVFP